MAVMEDLVVCVPIETAQQLRALVDARGIGTEGAIIAEALEALIEETAENQRISDLIAKGFDSITWHNPDEVRAALKERYSSF